MTSALVIVGCTRRKAAVTSPVPAYLLYQGGLVPALRDRLGTGSAWWEHVRFLSARYGVVHATQRLLPYDQPLTAEAARRLRPVVRRQFNEECARTPERLLIVCEPSYRDLLGNPNRPPAAMHWIGDIRGGWPQVAGILDSWGWR